MKFDRKFFSLALCYFQYLFFKLCKCLVLPLFFFFSNLIEVIRLLSSERVIQPIEVLKLNVFINYNKLHSDILRMCAYMLFHKKILRCYSNALFCHFDVQIFFVWQPKLQYQRHIHIHILLHI